LFSVASFMPAEQKQIINQKKSDELSYAYVIKDCDGKVCVFEKDNAKPILITDVLVSSLPQAEIEMLKTGIFVKDKAELDSLIEDYIS
jgi:hypothetical protein